MAGKAIAKAEPTVPIGSGLVTESVAVKLRKMLEETYRWAGQLEYHHKMTTRAKVQIGIILNKIFDELGEDVMNLFIEEIGYKLRTAYSWRKLARLDGCKSLYELNGGDSMMVVEMMESGQLAVDDGALLLDDGTRIPKDEPLTEENMLKLAAEVTRYRREKNRATSAMTKSQKWHDEEVTSMKTKIDSLEGTVKRLRDDIKSLSVIEVMDTVKKGSDDLKSIFLMTTMKSELSQADRLELLTALNEIGTWVRFSQNTLKWDEIEEMTGDAGEDFDVVASYEKVLNKKS